MVNVYLYAPYLPSAEFSATLEADGFSLHYVPRPEDLPTTGFALIVDCPPAVWVETYRRLAPRLGAKRLLWLVPPEARLSAQALELDEWLTPPLDALETVRRLQTLYRNVPLTETSLFSHDMRSPLSLLIPTLALLQETALADSAEDPLPRLLADAQHALYRQNLLLENLQDYLRLKRGEDDWLMLETRPLSEAASTFAEATHDILRRRNLTLELVFAPARLVKLDEALTQRVLLAVLDNSLKFCTSTSHLRLSIEGTSLIFSDTGRSVGPEGDALFNPHRQLALRLDGWRTSVAMHLPFVQSALALMGGRARAWSSENWTHLELRFAPA
jgi:signal transduction histidine kinase